MNEKELSEAIARGGNKIINRLYGVAAVFLLVYLALSLAIGMYSRDSTDSDQSRSDMSLHIDAMTGCHYLGGKRGGLVPRLAESGYQVCEDVK